MPIPFAFARNLQDASLNPVAFTLPAAASTSTSSTTVDLGAYQFQPEILELELSVPALSTVIVPAASTVTYLIETSAVSNFATIDQTLMSEVVTGAGAGVVAFLKRARLNPNCAQDLRFRVAFGAACTTGAAFSATPSLRF